MHCESKLFASGLRTILLPIYNLLILVTAQDATIELSVQVNNHNNYMIFFYIHACLFLHFHLLIGILNWNLMGILATLFIDNESTYLTMRLEAIFWLCNLIDWRNIYIYITFCTFYIMQWILFLCLFQSKLT